MSLWLVMIKIVSCVQCDNDTDTDTRSPAGPRKQTPTPDTISDTRPGEAGKAFLGLPSFQHKTRNMQCLNHQLDKNNANYGHLRFTSLLNCSYQIKPSLFTIRMKNQLWQLLCYKEKQLSAFFPFSNDIEFKLQKLTSVREHKLVFGQAYQDFQRKYIF